MTFDRTINLGHVLSTIGFAATIIGLLFTIRQIQRNGRTQRAQFMLSVIANLFADTAERKFWYKVDYDGFFFEDSTESLAAFKGSDDERYLDALLYKYDSIGRMVRLKIIELADIEPFLFEIIQVFHNDAVRAYIAWLDKQFEKHGTHEKNRRKRPHDDSRWLLEHLSKLVSP